MYVKFPLYLQLRQSGYTFRYELGQNDADLKACLPQLNIFGGCCGTDHRHVAAISRAVTLSTPVCRLVA